MEPLKIYDYLTRARQKVLGWARPLSPELHAREFPMGRKTLIQTLTHVMASEWYYIERLQGRDVPPYDRWPIREENPPTFPELETLWLAQSARTRAAIAAVRDWNAELHYRVDGDEGLEDITASASDIVTQLVLHEVHHRAQVLNMLRQLGVAAVSGEDIDFNAMMYKRRRV